MNALIKIVAIIGMIGIAWVGFGLYLCKSSKVFIARDIYDSLASL